MFEYNVINRKLKIEKLSKKWTAPRPKEIQKKENKQNHSFEFQKEKEKLPQKLRCQSTYSSECGFRSYKYQLFHDIISEYAEHKKHRLANYKHPQLEKPNLPPSQGSSRNIFQKGNLMQNHTYSNFVKKVKEFKISEQIVTERQFGMSAHENVPLTRQPSLDIDQILMTNKTQTLSCSRKLSPKYQFLQRPQLVFKSQFNNKNNVLEKILTEARTQIKTAQSPRSFGISHKKTKSQPSNVYASQNKLLQRLILNLK